MQNATVKGLLRFIFQTDDIYWESFENVVKKITLVSQMVFDAV